MRLPETWIEARLGDVLTRVDTKLDPQGSLSDSHFYVGLEHIESHTGRLLREVAEVTEGSDILSIKTVFKEGDILYGKLRPNLNKVLIANQDGICSTDIWALRTSEALLPEFALRYLRSPATFMRAAQWATGANLPRLSADAFDRIPVPVPTLPEQQRIVDVLRQADLVNDLASKARQLLDSLAKQRFAELFGHPAGNPKGFETAAFESFGTLDRGVSKYRPRDAGHLFGGTYPFIQTGDVSNAGDWLSTYRETYSEAGLAQSRLWPKGTLCITIAANIAKAALLEFDACFPDSVVGFTPCDGISNEYVLYCLRFYQEYFEHRAPKSAQMNINLDTLRSLHMPKPPEALQVEFSRFVHEMRRLTRVTAEQAHRRGVVATELTVAAFTGDLSSGWREQNRDQVAMAAVHRDASLRGRGPKVTIGASAIVAPAAQADLTARPARHWLLGELSDFQRQVLVAFTTYCQDSGAPLLAEDPDVFARFCDDTTVAERLQIFGTSHGNRIRRTLSQLAALGLIAKITLPKVDPERGERDYLKAFRPLRKDEFTRMADVQALRKAMSPDVDHENYQFQAQLDYETSERAGAGGMFQVISIGDDEGKDFTHLVDQGRHYASLDDLKVDLASALKVAAKQIDLEEK
jgi:type I restriction enzyme, S subunit